jgi:MraZ protein
MTLFSLVITIDAHNFPWYPISSHKKSAWQPGCSGPAKGHWEQRFYWGLGVALFLSTFVNKVDRKGRVSVPASFRAALTGQSFDGIVAFPSFVQSAIEASGIDRIESISAGIDQFDPFSDEYDAFANAILADSHQLAFGDDGRLVLPEVLRDHASIADQAAFVGRGPTFQIWEPGAFRIVQEEARNRAREERTSLRLKKPDGEGAQ